MDLSCIEQGQLCLETHEFDLCQALSGHVAHFQAQAQQQNKSFTFRMDVEYPMVLGDKVRLLQIMDNLLSNALKYTLPGDSISVTLSQAGADNKNYLFVVADTGIGMSQEFLKRLYDPYARERRFGANSVMGSGLGLTIVKNLVSQNGGDISVESAPGKGTCFRVTLPFVHAKSAQAGPVPAPAAADYSLSGKHVLVAEDNPSNRDILTELLTEDGAIVTGRRRTGGGGCLLPLGPLLLRRDPHGPADAPAGRLSGRPGHPGAGPARCQVGVHPGPYGQHRCRGYGQLGNGGNGCPPVQAGAHSRHLPDSGPPDRQTKERPGGK